VEDALEMNDRIRRWDERFAHGEELHGYAPSPPLPAAVEGLAPGLALDLACGAGRHSVFLAERGWRVHAIDGSREGLKRLSRLARERGVESMIEPHLADLEAPDFALAEKPGLEAGGGWREAGGFDLICDFYFLHRPLFEQIHRALRPGGRFVAAIHVRTSPDETGHFLLEPGELRGLAVSWGCEILHAREGAAAESDHQHGTAELIARRPA
jgi:SAM-dependent methyltransferase